MGRRGIVVVGGVVGRDGSAGAAGALLLALAVCAMLCSCGSYAAASDWGRLHRDFCLEHLGFDPRKQLPCVATFSRVFRWLDAAEFERVIQAWIARCLGMTEDALRGYDAGKKPRA